MPNQDIHEAVLEFEDAAQDALYPLRSKIRPTDAAGFREAWMIVELLWDDTVSRARSFVCRSLFPTRPRTRGGDSSTTLSHP